MSIDIKFHEGLTLRWFETPEWSVFVDERGVPNGFEHAERGDELVVVCGSMAECWWITTVYSVCRQA
jgi:hypothetical protein